MSSRKEGFLKNKYMKQMPFLFLQHFLTLYYLTFRKQPWEIQLSVLAVENMLQTMWGWTGGCTEKLLSRCCCSRLLVQMGTLEQEILLDRHSSSSHEEIVFLIFKKNTQGFKGTHVNVFKCDVTWCPLFWCWFANCSHYGVWSRHWQSELSLRAATWSCFKINSSGIIPMWYRWGCWVTSISY